METDYLTKAEHDEFARRIDEHNRRTDARISDLEGLQKQQTDILLSINDLTNATKLIAQNQSRQEEKIDGISKRIDDIEKEPVKTWWSFKSALIGALGSAIGAGIIALLINVL